MNKILLITLFSFLTFAESLDFRDIFGTEKKNIKFVKIAHITRGGETLAMILKRYIKDDSVVSSNEMMVKKTFAANPEDIDWKSLPAKRKLIVYLDVDFIDLEKMQGFGKKIAKRTEEVKKQLKESRKKNFLPGGLRGSLFYMASLGMFTEKDPEIANLSFSQNSPITLGLSGSYYQKDSNISYSSSAYFSYLFASNTNLSNESEVDIPLEIGATFYTEYRWRKHNITLYGGVDFEKFTTFNLEGALFENSVFFDVNKVLYVTGGVAGKYKLFGENFFSKLSLSQSVTSSRSVGYAASTKTQAFKGNKILFYLFKRINQKFFGHMLLKYHWMSGPADITTKRVGIGFGYMF